MRLPHGVSMQATRGSLIVRSTKHVRVLSSAILNGGWRRADSILIQKVPKNFRCDNPLAYLLRAAARTHLDANTTVGFLTAADPSKFGFSTCQIGRVMVSTVATAGTSNSARAGEPIKILDSPGTINTLVLTNARMTDGCIVNALQTATEAKTLALRELDIRSSNSGGEATCTTSDALVIGTTNEGAVCKYAGAATELGRAIAESVRLAVRDGITKHDKIFPGRSLLQRLCERGIDTKDLEDAFFEKYIHHQSFGSRNRVRKTFRRFLEEASSDHNVAALVLAALRIEDDGCLGLIPGLSEKEFVRDPVSLLADELIGIAISNYIAGSKGLFEYVRFDRKKPSVIRRLGPFGDDAVGALVAGASSNVYSSLLGKR